jgi:predicted trehalose synthase
MLEFSNGAQMTEGVENLILEPLKRFHAGQERIERKLDEVVTRLGHVETGLAGLRREFAYAEESAASMGVRMDRINERIERIEKRLELA